MTQPKLLPYINRFNGEVQIMSRRDAKEQLNEDWARAKVVTNNEGKKVFRFELNAPVKGRDGKTHMGTAVVDLTEIDQPIEGEVING